MFSISEKEEGSRKLLSSLRNVNEHLLNPRPPCGAPQLPLWESPFCAWEGVGSVVLHRVELRKGIWFVIYEVNYYNQLVTGYENN